MQAEEREEGVAKDGTGAAQPCVRDGHARTPPPAPFLPMPEQVDAEQGAREEENEASGG